MLPDAKFLPLDGLLDGDELEVAFVARYPRAIGNEGRWFLDEPVHDAGRTWVLSKMWGLQTEAALDALVQLAPDAGVYFTAA